MIVYDGMPVIELEHDIECEVQGVCFTLHLCETGRSLRQAWTEALGRGEEPYVLVQAYYTHVHGCGVCKRVFADNWPIRGNCRVG